MHASVACDAFDTGHLSDSGMTTRLRTLRFGNCLLKLAVRNAAATSAVPSLRSSLPRTGSQDAGLWDVLEYNSHYFNPHRMAPLLAQVLEEPRLTLNTTDLTTVATRNMQYSGSEARGDARLHAYLQKARHQVSLDLC